MHTTVERAAAGGLQTGQLAIPLPRSPLSRLPLPQRRLPATHGSAQGARHPAGDRDRRTLRGNRRLRHLAIAVLVNVLLAAIAVADGRAQAQDLVSCSDDDPKVAIARCSEQLTKGGQSENQLAYTLALRGFAYSDSRDCVRAVTDFTSALEIVADFAVVYAQRGRCHLRLSEFDRAIADLTQALALDDKQWFLHLYRASAWTAKGEALRTLTDMAAAIDHARRVTGQSADDLYYNALGHAWRHDYDSAVRVLDEALARDPRHQSSLSLRADVLLGLGRYAEAVVDYTKSIELRPGEPEGYVGRGEAHGRLGDTAGQTRDLERALALIPNPVEAWDFNARAWALHLLGRNEQALGDVEEALRRLPNDTAQLHTRGRILEALGRREAAIADYRLGLRFDPGHRETLAELRRLGELPAKKQ